MHNYNNITTFFECYMQYVFNCTETSNKDPYYLKILLEVGK